MHVTAKLSKEFYARLGDQVVNELVEWFNRVDATYKGELRELNELNFARFTARMDQRFAEFEVRFAQFEARMEKRQGELEVRMERGFKEQTRWMFVAWTSLMIPIMGLWFR